MVGDITTLCADDKPVQFLKHCVHSEHTLTDGIQRPNDRNTLFTELYALGTIFVLRSNVNLIMFLCDRISTTHLDDATCHHTRPFVLSHVQAG
jgi:hypothetical protein